MKFSSRPDQAPAAMGRDIPRYLGLQVRDGSGHPGIKRPELANQNGVRAPAGKLHLPAGELTLPLRPKASHGPGHILTPYAKTAEACLPYHAGGVRRARNVGRRAEAWAGATGPRYGQVRVNAGTRVGSGQIAGWSCGR